jgi:hypothetical protein
METSAPPPGPHGSRPGSGTGRRGCCTATTAAPWSFDDGASIRPVGLTATAGKSYLEFSPVGGSDATMRPGSFDTKARLADMAVDGIWNWLDVDHLMWSSDYPHTGRDWPNSRSTIERNFRGVPRHEVEKMLHDHCERLHEFDHVPDWIPHP